MSDIINLKPMYRGSELVKVMDGKLPYMSLHCATDLPLTRYDRRLTQDERNKPINLEYIGNKIHQTLQISYNTEMTDGGAPSVAIYNILAAIYWKMQEDGYNSNGTLCWDGINWIRKRTGCHPDVIKSDLTKLTTLHIKGNNILYDINEKKYRVEDDFQPFRRFIRLYEGDSKLPRHVIFKIDPDFLSYIQNNLIHTNQTYWDYIRMKSILAKLLFIRLIKYFYDRDYYHADMERLGRWLLLENKSVYSMRQSFERAGEELKKIGLLKRVPIIERSKTDRKRFTLGFIKND